MRFIFDEDESGNTRETECVVNQFCTVVVRMPSDEAQRSAVSQALEALRPHQVAMSLDDEMTTLELIEQHPDFPEHVATEARAQVRELHLRGGADERM